MLVEPAIIASVLAIGGVPVLPRPTGPHAVGTTILHLLDSARAEPADSSRGRRRELTIQLFYPGAPGFKGATSRYIPDPRVVRAMIDSSSEAGARLIRRWAEIRTSARLDAPPDNSAGRLPLLLLAGGCCGLGTRSNYTAMAEELASHGYVVATIDHAFEDSAMPLADGTMAFPRPDPPGASDEVVSGARAVRWADDDSFILDQLVRLGAAGTRPRPLAGRVAALVDTTRVGALGHSMGGAAAWETCSRDRRFKACANLDGKPFGSALTSGLSGPSLMLRSQPNYSDADFARRGTTREAFEKMGAAIMEELTTVFVKQPGTPVYFVRIRPTNHSSFSDTPFNEPELIAGFGGEIMAPARVHRITTAYLRAFFDQYLNGRPSPLLRESSGEYPEATLRRFNPGG